MTPQAPTPWAGRDLRGRMLVLHMAGVPVLWQPGTRNLSATQHGRAVALRAPRAVADQLLRLKHPATGVLRQVLDVRRPAPPTQAALLHALSGAPHWQPSVRLSLLDLLEPGLDYPLRLWRLRDALSPWGYREQLEDPTVLGIAGDSARALQLIRGQLARPCVAGVLAYPLDAHSGPAAAPWLITQACLATPQRSAA
jgi:hypothetical protein